MTNTHRTAAQAEKELADNAKLLRAWKQFHRDERAEVLAGQHGAVLSELFWMFANLKHVRPEQLIGLVQSIDWASIPYAAKLVTVHELNTAITRLRERHGLPPIDDPLPGEPDNPFHVIRAIVLVPNSEGHRA
jgi:hypothetical protein